jgi:hypothetical protein
MAFHSKMYKDEPTLKRDEKSGKVGVNKKQKEAADVDAQVDGMPIHDEKMVELHHKHSKERLEMHHKHEKELMEHMHTMGKAGKSEEHESKGSDDGEKKIKKVEKGE